MKISDIVSGKKVLCEPYGNFYSRGQEPYVLDGTVTKIGRKHFYVVVGTTAYPFNKETCEFIDNKALNGGYILFPSRQAWEEELEKRSLIKGIKETVFYNAPSEFGLNELRLINQLLNGKKVAKLFPERYAVVYSASHTRDTQVYIGPDPNDDDIDSERWVDANGPFFVGIYDLKEGETVAGLLESISSIEACDVCALQAFPNPQFGCGIARPEKTV